MRLNNIFAAWLGVAATTTSAIGLHKAVDSLIQVTPSFSGDGVLMHPGLAPGHDSHDLEHLIPGIDKVLHYSQEGHRPALHGAKHASLEAKFARGTVVLDHSDHIKSVTCDNNDIQVCFKNSHALKAVEDSWGSDGNFNLVTYHVGCGDESSGRRTFFHASPPSVNPENMCVVMSVNRIDESEALHSGVLSWGTYTDPSERRRSPVKGHVRVNRPMDYSKYGNGTMPSRVNGTGTIDRTMDIVDNPWALETFFNNSHMDTSDMGAMIPTMDFVDMEDDAIPTNTTRRMSTRSRFERTRRSMTEVSNRNSSELVRRDFFRDVWNGLRDLGRRIGRFFKSSFNVILKVGDFIVNVAEITAKLLLVPFGAPFNHSYHNDIQIREYLTAEATNRPPKIFGIGNGFTLAKSIEENANAAQWSVQCAKCGVHVNMNIDGRLAFSIKNGITEGKIQLTNVDPLTLDAQFGITASGTLISRSKNKHLKRKEKEIKTIPLSPLTIPGILTLGPQVSFSVALSVAAEGKVELLVGGSVSIGAGTATASVKGGQNGIEGLKPSFNPIFRAKGEFTVTGDLGVPVALEVGLDIFEGKFKKTVGLVNTPSIYLEARVTNDKAKPCYDGVKLSVGAKNRMHVAGFDIWEHELANIPIFQKTIGCVSVNGFSPGDEKPDKGLIKAVNKKTGGDLNAGKPYIADATKRLPKVEPAQGFRLLMDGQGDTIMVSGNNGGLYLVGKHQGYDVSAPWGTLDTKTNPLTLDVFGRVLAYKLLPPLTNRKRHSSKIPPIGQIAPILADLVVKEPKKMPMGYKSTAIKQLESNGGKIPRYGIPLVFENKFASGLKPIYYPTACKTRLGLEVIATREIISKDGKVKSQWLPGLEKEFEKDMKQALRDHYGVNMKDCRTIQLVTGKA